MSWQPDDKQLKYVDLLVSMCVDTKLGKGPEDGLTFCQNLLMIAEQLHKTVEDRTAGVPIIK